MTSILSTPKRFDSLLTPAGERYFRRFAKVCGMLFVGFCFTPAALSAASLPQEEPYQQVLYKYLGSLKESDFDPGQEREDARIDDLTGEALYLHWVLSQREDRLGIGAPSSAYLLSSIEANDTVMQPKGLELSRWAKIYPDKFENSRALRLRAFVPAAIDLMMLDSLYEKPEGRSISRSDFLGGTLIWMAYNYSEAKADLPEEVQEAYETGLRKMVDRLKAWGPAGLHTNMDLFTPVGLSYAQKAINDPAVTATAIEVSKRLFTDPDYYDPAGFFVEEGGFDTSYNGIALFFATWAALISDWDFVHTALDQAFKLRAHLSLPEPPGVVDKAGRRIWSGPTHFSSRTSGDSPSDQWGWEDRNIAASWMIDHALPLVPMPDEAALRKPSRIATSDEMPAPWNPTHWIRSNLATEFNKPGFYDRLVKLHAEDSALVKLPFDRPGGFIEQFGDSLVIAKFAHYGAVIFCGKVSTEYTGIARGFGGGNISAFWMPEGGSMILGRRGGTQGDHPDLPEEWRNRPVNAISGQTANGKMFSSSRCQMPERTIKIEDGRFDVTVKGEMGTYPSRIALRGIMNYERRFIGDEEGVTVESSVQSDSKDVLGKMHETIPFFLKDTRHHSDDVMPLSGIEFKVGSIWQSATVEPVDNVTTIRVHRYEGALEVQLEKPSRVHLSPEEWVDQYQSRATCRNVMIDYVLPDKGGEPFQTRMKYRVAPLVVRSGEN